MKSMYYFRVLFCVVLSILLISCGSDRDPTVSDRDPTVSDQLGPNSPFFWTVEKEGKISYLLGTYHIGVSVYELFCSEFILEKLRGSDLVFVESKKDALDSSNLGKELFLSENNEDFNSLSSYSQSFLTAKGINSSLSFFWLYCCLVLSVYKRGYRPFRYSYGSTGRGYSQL